MAPQAAPAQTARHVLVLGAGLAGMRAAWAAKLAAPQVRVTLVCPRAAPCGSSFANRNNALGMQAPAPGEAQDFVREALALAAPGAVAPELARALAQDAPAVLADLLSLGLCFRREADGALSRFPGCFSPARRAVVFDGLQAAQGAFLSRLKELGVELLHGFEALHIARDAAGRAAGAHLAALRGAQIRFLRADAVVAALGGPSPLFARRICGPGGSGLGLGLLCSAGAELVNAEFLQFFWGEAADGGFVNPGHLPWSRLAPELAHLAETRRGHCPLAYSLPDAALDRWLLERRGADGLVRLPGRAPLALFAHAGNGGARIDEHGRTTVPGLYACGECAGGMHGAQRLGGGMVLSALVFGARAGRAAALDPEPDALGHGPDGDPPGQVPAPAPGLALRADAAFLRRLRRGMDRHAAPYARHGRTRAAFAAWLRTQGKDAPSLRQRLLALSALCVLDGV